MVGEGLQPLEQRAARVGGEPGGGELAQPGHGHQSARRHEQRVQAHVGPQGQDLCGDGLGGHASTVAGGTHAVAGRAGRQGRWAGTLPSAWKKKAAKDA